MHRKQITLTWEFYPNEFWKNQMQDNGQVDYEPNRLTYG